MDTIAYAYDGEKTRTINRIEFTLLGGDEIANNSALGKNSQGIDKPDLYENLEAKRNGLIDTRMGTTDNSVDCGQCGLNTIFCGGHFGHITLAEPVFHLGYLKYVKNILSCICLKCSKLLIYKNEDDIIEMLKNKSGKTRMAEIRNLVKHVTVCQKQYFGCGMVVSKIKIDEKKSTAVINIVSEINLANIPTEEGGVSDGKKKSIFILTPEKCYNILSNISDRDCMILGLDPKHCRPEMMIHKIFPVPPVPVRPSTRADFLASSTMEDDLTHKLADIIKANLRVMRHKEAATESTMKYGQDNIYLLQYHVATYFDNETLSLPKSEKGKETRSLSYRLKGKEGRIRGNLMGKRVDFSARTVITPDPTIDINQVGIPIKIAMNVTFPEIVTPYNIEAMTKLVRNGRDVYPGANFVFQASSIVSGQRVLPIDLRYKKETIDLKIGDIVERHFVNNDIVLLNRQPTLHKHSMMGFYIKVINDHSLNTFRLSVAICHPFNADFDGDEMNIFLPQSIQTQIELEEIADAKRQVMSQSTSAATYGIVQDGLVGGYNLTEPSVRIDWKNAMNMMTYTSIENFEAFKKKRDFTGCELFSMIIPKKINMLREKDGKTVLSIKNGELLEGRMKKDYLGNGKRNNLVQLIWDEYGVEDAKKFIDDTQRLMNNYNLLNGFTIGIKDISISKETEQQIHNILEAKEAKVCNMITEVENNHDLMDEDLFERTLFAELNVSRDDIGKLIMNTTSNNNNVSIMSLSGSKGSLVNSGQMSGCLGLQAIEGELPQKKLNGRTLPCFHENDDTAGARGLIKQSCFNGMNYPEFFFANMAAREGIIDQVIKSVTGDTPIIIKEDGEFKHVRIGDWIDSKLSNNNNIIKYDEKNMELLNINNNIYVPTVNEIGNVSWASIVAITRHDPGNELYEIKTKYGRKVIVTESKSLLVWNNDVRMFLEKPTPDVKLGDYVPVTMLLNNSNKSYDIDNSINIDDYENGYIVGRQKNIEKPIQYLNKSDTFIKRLVDGYLEINNTYYSENIEDINVMNMLFNMCGYITKLENNNVKVITNYNNNIKYINDAILDEIIEINKIDVSLYPKVYDLTIPDTLNFCLANGLHVVDTADTGYMQRKLIKKMEDAMIKYDGTVRLADNVILQFIYGDCGTDGRKQYEHNIEMIEQGNSEIRSNCFTEEELKMYSDTKYNKVDNDIYYNILIEMRDMLRETQRKTKMSSMTLTQLYMLPINMYRIVENAKSKNDKSDKLDPHYIISEIDRVFDNKYTNILCLTEKERNDKKSLKHNDDRISKTVLRCALYEYLSPKRCLIHHKLNKTQFDLIINDIINNFNKNMVEPGEMVGILAAQAIGEQLTQMNLNSFHSAGVSSMNSTTLGIPRIKELLTLSKKIKTPQMVIFLTKEFTKNRSMANKIASYIKYITISQLRKKISVSYDSKPYDEDSYREKDKAYNVFYSNNPGKYSCQANIASLPWLMRIVFDREKLAEKEISLLDIKSKFCNSWEKRQSEMKNVRKEDRAIYEKVSQCAIISNTENDEIPVIHNRFDMTDIDFTLINDFIDIVDKFKLKGINSITESYIIEERVLTFDDNKKIVKNNQFVIYTLGVNMYDIRYLIGIDIYNTICNDVIQTYEIFGIEAARATLIKEIIHVYESSGARANFQHFSVLADIITNGGELTSVDRHGMNKSDADPLSRASFEKTVDQLLASAVFSEVDRMKGISSRIMAGMVIKGGTGLCDLLLDVDMIEKSEFTEDLSQKYIKTYNEITTSTLIEDVNKENSDIFIPNY